MSDKETTSLSCIFCGGEITCICGDSDIHCFGGVWKPENDFDWTDVDCQQHAKLTASAGIAARHSVQATIQSVCASATWLILNLNPSGSRNCGSAEFEHDSTKAQVSCTKNSVATQVGTGEKTENLIFGSALPLESLLVCCRQVEKRKVSHQSCQAEDKPNTPWIWPSSTVVDIQLICQHSESFFTPMPPLNQHVR